MLTDKCIGPFQGSPQGLILDFDVSILPETLPGRLHFRVLLANMVNVDDRED